MPPFIAAALPSILSAIPALVDLFKGDSPTSERNAVLAEKVVYLAKSALSVRNEQELVEQLETDPKAAEAVRAAIEAQWFTLVEAGGGGIAGARQAEKAFMEGKANILQSPSFWIALMLLPLVYLLVMSLIGLIGTAVWSDDVRAGLSGSLISAIVGGLVGYYYGQTTSRNRTPT